KRLPLLGTHAIEFDPQRDIAFLGERSMPEHPNAMRVAAFDAAGALLREAHYFSVGGGFVVEGGAEAPATSAHAVPLPFPFGTGDELMAHAAAQQRSIASLVLANECAWRPEAEVRAGLLRIWQVMQDCVERGFGIDNAQAAEPLPGALHM